MIEDKNNKLKSAEDDRAKSVKILIANPGSTSLKFKIYLFPAEEIIASGKIEKIGSAKSPFSFSNRDNKISGEEKISDYKEGISKIIKFLLESKVPVIKSLNELSAIGFKTVHAGMLGRGPGATFLTTEIMQEMEKMLVLAPAHNKAYIDVIRCFEEIIPNIPRAGLFEPAYHSTITDEKNTYGIPIEWKEKFGVMRYGFHGASHRYIGQQAPKIMGWDNEKKSKGKIISCHLGGSSSLCAIIDEKSVDTTMGFSPQSGILHSTRCENLDPFVVIFAQKVLGYSVDEISDIFCKKSGLAGISKTSGDMRDLWDAYNSGSKRAELAIEIFFYQVRREIAAMASSLRGADAIIFTGGIGEKGNLEREKICQGLDWLGVQIDIDVNNKIKGTTGKISSDESKVEVWVIPTDEELVVGREIFKLLRNI